jgi:acyl carrier protein
MDVRIRRIFRDVFDDEHMEISDEMSSADVTGWDSLTQVRLLIALEEEFGVKFQTNEVIRLTTLAEIKKSLQQKLESRE